MKVKRVVITLYGREAQRVIDGVEYGAHFRADYIEGFEVDITPDDLQIDEVEEDE